MSEVNLPDSIYDLERFHIDWSRAKYEWRRTESPEEWVPCVVLGVDGSTIRVAFLCLGAVYAVRIDSRSDEWKYVLRPRREKRRVKGWVMVRRGKPDVLNVTVYKHTAREWDNLYHRDYTIVPFTTDEFIDGERPDFAAEEPAPPALRPGVKVRIQKPDDPEKHGCCLWIPEMDRFGGMTGTLALMYNDKTWKIMGAETWRFHPDWLTAVESENSQKTP